MKEAYYKNIFGEDVFKKLEKDIYEGYKEIALEYANRQYYGETANMSIGDELEYLYERSKQPPLDIVTEKEGDIVVLLPHNNRVLEKKQIEISDKREFDKLPTRTEIDSVRRPTVAAMKIVITDTFLLDIVCCILKSEKEKLNEKDEDKYVELVSSVKDVNSLQIQFEKFRRNGRKRDSSAVKIQKISHYGYPFPIDAKICAEVGKKTRVENIVPNIFRLFVFSEEIRKLYVGQSEKAYNLSKILEVLKSVDINFSVLEKYQLEEILGINLAIQTVNALNKETWGELTNVDKRNLRTVIETYLIEIMQWKGVYSRCKLVKAINSIAFPAELYKGDYLTQAEKKINYMRELTWVLRQSMSASYSLMYGLIETFVYLESKTTKERIRYIEENLIPQITKNMFKQETYSYLNEIYGLKESVGRDEQTYSIIQKCIILNKIPG